MIFYLDGMTTTRGEINSPSNRLFQGDAPCALFLPVGSWVTMTIVFFEFRIQPLP